MVACIDVASNGSTNPADNPTATTFFTQMFSNLPQSNLILRMGSTSLPTDFLNSLNAFSSVVNISE